MKFSLNRMKLMANTSYIPLNLCWNHLPGQNPIKLHCKIRGKISVNRFGLSPSTGNPQRFRSPAVAASLRRLEILVSRPAKGVETSWQRCPPQIIVIRWVKPRTHATGWVRQGWHSQYMENKHVPNHQPVHRYHDWFCAKWYPYKSSELCDCLRLHKCTM